MSETTIMVPFGKEGYRAMWAVMKPKLQVNSTPEQLKEAVEAGTWFLVEKVEQEMKKQGYRSIGRGRAIFEDALDWQARLMVPQIIQKKLKEKKVWVNLPFKVSVPKVE